MSKCRLRVRYDETKKLWKSVLPPNTCALYGWMGSALLSGLRAQLRDKVLEYYYDLKLERTVEDLLRESIAVARNLWRLGIKRGDVVILYSMNNPQLSVLAFGCYIVGAVVNFFEPRLSAAHIDEALSLMRPSMVLFEEQWRIDLYDSLQRCSLQSLKHILSIDSTGCQSNVRTELLRELPSDDEIQKFCTQESVLRPRFEVAAYVFTAGTATGKPKICKITHAQLLYGAFSWFSSMDSRLRLRKNPAVCSFSTPSCISQIQMMLQPVFFGVKRICSQRLPDDLDIGDYGRDIIHDANITHLYTTPNIFANILDAIDDEEESALKSLCILGLTGEPASPQLLENARNAVRRKCRIYLCYFMTETASLIANDETVNGGGLLPGFMLKIVNDDRQLLGPGQRGQLFIKTPCPFRGYLNDRDHENDVDNGFFLNGDYGYMDEKNLLHIESRYQDVVRSKELQLNANLIESVVVSLMEVNSACLVSYVSQANQAQQTPALFVVPSFRMRNARKLRTTIKQTLVQQLPSWEIQHIRHIYFMREMPVIAKCGLIDRAVLRKEAVLREKGISSIL